MGVSLLVDGDGCSSRGEGELDFGESLTGGAESVCLGSLMTRGMDRAGAGSKKESL